MAQFLFSPARNSKPAPVLTAFEGTAMTIDYKILIGNDLSTMEKAQAKKIIFNTFQEVNDVFNRWNPNSELSKLNKAPAGVKVKISKSLENFLKIVDKAVSLTEGRFDPTIEPLQNLWKQNLILGQRADPLELKKIIPSIGWNKIHFSDGYFYKDHDLTGMDLGGIAKGYCIDLIVERLTECGFKNLFVEWGGEIRTSGKHPEGRPWNVFISRLGNSDPKTGVAVISLINQSAATSGDYQQQWSFEDPLTKKTTTYFHIINPETFQPLESTKNSIASTTVLAPSCAIADGLSTALMLFPTVQEAEIWAKTIEQKIEGFRFWIQANDSDL